MQRLPMEATGELLMQRFPATTNTLKKEGSKTKLVKKKKLSNHNSNGSAGANKGAYGSKRGSSSGKHAKI